MMITDHSAIKTILETPKPYGKHARWWLKVFGSGIKRVEIKSSLEETTSKVTRYPGTQFGQLREKRTWI